MMIQLWLEVADVFVTSPVAEIMVWFMLPSITLAKDNHLLAQAAVAVRRRRRIAPHSVSIDFILATEILFVYSATAPVAPTAFALLAYAD